MSSRIKPSYDIKSQPILTPSQNYELEPDNTAPKSSYDLTRPTEGFPTDYVSRTYGGSFYGLVKYNSGYSITDNFHLVYKSWVEDYVATSIAELEAGGLSQATILGWISSSAGTPLTYNNNTGVFTLDKDLSEYDNTTSGFITSADIPAESDPTVGAHIKTITPTNISNWNTAYGWGNHSGLYKDISYVPAWADITGKPTVFPVDVHTHTTANITDGTTVGINLFTLTNPSAVRFLRTNADNTVSALTASDFRTAIGAGTSSTTGTVTSVGLSVPTGLSVSGSPITANGTLAITLTAGYSIPTTVKQGQWDTAYGWGNHAGLYDTVNTASGLISTHESTYTHSLIATALQDITGESVHSLSDFPALGTSLQFLRVNTDGLGLEFHTIGHGDLSAGSMNSNDTYLHLTSAEKAKISQAATTLTDGYMTSTQVIALENALTAFTAGTNALDAALIYNRTTDTLVLADDIPTLDDTATDDSHVLSASKILSLFEGSTEEGSYAKSYTIAISAGADLATKLALSSTVPTGWSLSANGANLEITHNISKTPVGIAVYRITSTGTKQKLEGNTAYSNATSNSTDTILTLSAYAGTTDATEIRLSF